MYVLVHDAFLSLSILKNPTHFQYIFQLVSVRCNLFFTNFSLLSPVEDLVMNKN